MRPFGYVDLSSQNSLEYWLQFPAKLMEEFWELKYTYRSYMILGLISGRTCIISKWIWLWQTQINSCMQPERERRVEPIRKITKIQQLGAVGPTFSPTPKREVELPLICLIYCMLGSLVLWWPCERKQSSRRSWTDVSIWLELGGGGAKLGCRSVEYWKQMQFCGSSYSLDMEDDTLEVLQSPTFAATEWQVCN